MHRVKAYLLALTPLCCGQGRATRPRAISGKVPKRQVDRLDCPVAAGAISAVRRKV